MIFLDCEASRHPDGFPIEVGIAQILPDRTIISDARLIRCDSWLARADRWDAAAEAAHHISREDLVQFGRPPHEVAAWLNDRLAGQLALADNEADHHWIAELFATAGMPQKFEIASWTQALAWPEIDDAAAELLQRDLNIRVHRAAADAAQLAEIVAGAWSPCYPNSIFPAGRSGGAARPLLLKRGNMGLSVDNLDNGEGRLHKSCSLWRGCHAAVQFIRPSAQGR